MLKDVLHFIIAYGKNQTLRAFFCVWGLKFNPNPNKKTQNPKACAIFLAISKELFCKEF
jgi:hypothetical protein